MFQKSLAQQFQSTIAQRLRYSLTALSSDLARHIPACAVTRSRQVTPPVSVSPAGNGVVVHRPARVSNTLTRGLYEQPKLL